MVRMSNGTRGEGVGERDSYACWRQGAQTPGRARAPGAPEVSVQTPPPPPPPPP